MQTDKPTKAGERTQESRIETLNRAFELHKDDFAGSFHTVLWEILANNSFADKVAAFCNNYRDGGNQLGVAIANERGYCPTPAYFKDGLTQDEVWSVLASLNGIVFGLNEETAMNVLCSSMAKGRELLAA